jgi:biopolymer transport protein TolQ
LVPFLATTGNTTPFIGLFGTVWGIMNSFHGIGLRGSASLAVVAPGISEALVATAAGLAAAIPAVIAFNHFMNRIRIMDAELQNFSADFLNIVERDILAPARRRA